MGFGGTRGFGTASGSGGGGGSTAFSINIISGNNGPYELGEDLVDPEFTLSYHNGPATEMKVTDPDAAETESADPFNAVVAEGTFSRDTLGTLTFAFHAEKDLESNNKNKAIAWYPLVYWGVADEGDTVDQALLEGLSDSVLTSSRVRSVTASPGVGEKIFYAIPSSFGTPVFTVEGFEGGFELADTITVTNANGIDIEYAVYRSEQANLGSTNISIT